MKDRERITSDDVEVALFVAIGNKDERIVTSGASEPVRQPLDRVYEISCRREAFGTWACTVLLVGGSAVACTIDKVATNGEVHIDGRVHCRY